MPADHVAHLAKTNPHHSRERYRSVMRVILEMPQSEAQIILIGMENAVVRQRLVPRRTGQG
jgi:predicted kinase